MSLPKELRIFVNEVNDPFLQVCRDSEEAFIESGGGEDVVVGIYRLERRVHLKYSVKEEDL